MTKELLKSYSLDIDFLDYNKSKNIPNNIIYSDSDVNSTFINATLFLNGEAIDLTNTTVTVGVRDVNDNGVVNQCEIVSATEGKIKIPFVTSSLSTTGFSKFDISVTKEDKKIVSPSFNFRIVESVTNDEAITSNPSYDILTILIDKVEELQTLTEGLIVDVSNLNTTITEAEKVRQAQESARQSNETKRVQAENTRVSQESTRQAQESDRKTAETSRVNAESTRVNAENTRKSQESARVSAEQSRVITESQRVQAESTRVSQETSRTSAESLRIQSEDTRKSNEAIRESNEAERVVAEEDRNSRFLVMEDKVNKFIRDEAIWEVVEG